MSYVKNLISKMSYEIGEKSDGIITEDLANLLIPEGLFSEEFDALYNLCVETEYPTFETVAKAAELMNHIAEDINIGYGREIVNAFIAARSEYSTPWEVEEVTEDYDNEELELTLDAAKIKNRGERLWELWDNGFCGDELNPDWLKLAANY